VYRRYARLYLRVARRHIRLVGVSAGIGVAIVMAALVGSCRDRGTLAPSRPTPPRQHAGLPSSQSKIRVRIVDATDVAAVGATGPCRIVADGALRHTTQQAMAPTEIRRNGGMWIVGTMRIPAARLSVEPRSTAAFVTCNERRYRGALVLLNPVRSPDRFVVNNELPIEHYLAGVLARELLRGWNLETYKALAVTARTYAMYEMTHNGRERSFDVYADQRSQVYGGVDDETTKSVGAVRATYGLVLSSTQGPTPRIFKAYYSSCCGGMTCPAQGLEQQDEYVAALDGGVECTDCKFSRRYRWGPVRIDKQAAFEALRRQYPKIAAARSGSGPTTCGWRCSAPAFAGRAGSTA